MKNQKQFRHGDILLVEVKELPKEAKVKKEKMLAAGEHSNHGHFVCGDVEVLERMRVLLGVDEHQDVWMRRTH